MMIKRLITALAINGDEAFNEGFLGGFFSNSERLMERSFLDRLLSVLGDWSVISSPLMVCEHFCDLGFGQIV